MQKFNQGLSFSTVCILLFVALCPFEDIYEGALSSAGRSLSLYPLLLLAAAAGANWIIRGNYRVNVATLLTVAYVVIITLFGLVVFGTSNLGQNLVVKSVTSSIPLALFLFAVFAIDYKQPYMKEAVAVAFCFLIAGFLFSDLNLFGLKPLFNNSIFHYSHVVDRRAKGFASEASVYSQQIIGIGLLLTSMVDRRFWKILVGIVTVLLLIASGSKGGLSTIFLCLVLYIFIRWHSRWYHVILLTGSLSLLALIAVKALPLLFTTDVIETFSTIATRGGMITCAIQIIWQYPFGVGLSGFVPAIQKTLPSSIDFIQSFFKVRFNLQELLLYMKTSEFVSTKTFFFDQLIRFGLPFAAAYFYLTYKIGKQLLAQNKAGFWMVFACTMIAITTYIQPVGAYSTAIVLGVILNETRQENSGRDERLSVSA